MERPSNCNDCPYTTVGRGYVPACGPINARLVLIGEAPASEELTTGKPFQGPAGEELNSLLVSAGIPRDEVYITNTIHCALPEGMKEDAKFRMGAECRRRHPEEEAALSPHVVVPLGGVALGVFMEKSGITKWRGSVYPLEFNGRVRKFIPTFHPAAVMLWQRSRKFRPVAKTDWKKIARQMITAELPELDENFVTEPSFDEVMMFLGRLLKLKHAVSYDIETTGLNIHDCDIICIGMEDLQDRIDKGISTTYCIPIFNDDGSPYWKEEQLVAIVEKLQAVFADSQIAKGTQNGTFDESVLLLRGFDFAGPRLDTCFWHHVLFAELPHSLGFIKSVYTDGWFHKDDVKGDELANTSEERTIDTVFRTYNCKDVHSTSQGLIAMARESAQRGLTEFYQKFVAPAHPAIADMQATGIAYDTERRDEIADQMEPQMACLRDELQATAGRQFEPTNKGQVAEIIFGQMGYRAEAFTANAKRPTVDKDVIKHLYMTTPSAEDKVFFGKLKQYNELQKRHSTFILGEDMNPCSDGRIRSSWKIHGARTGRLSSSRPNLMNIPDGLCREPFAASKGNILLYMDMKSFESWIGALYSGDDTLLASLRSGKDIHLENAVLFGITASYEEAQRLHKAGDPIFAQARLGCKNYKYGEQYGAGPETIWDQICLRMDDPPTLAEVATWHSAYQLAHPKYTRMRNEIADTIRRTRLLSNGHGRQRYHLGPPYAIVTEGYNFPIQSLAADILLRIQAEIFQALPWRGKIVAQVHDALLFDVPLHLSASVRRIAEDKAKQPFRFKDWYGNTIEHSFDVDFKEGDNWGQMGELT